MYYSKLHHSLCSIFGTENIEINSEYLQVQDRKYPIIDDVIILLNQEQYPASVREHLGLDMDANSADEPAKFAEDIQFTFGEEWKTYNEVLPEHKKEFNEYFDLINLDELNDKRVCDMGCGIGRWAYFLKDSVSEIVLVDFSEAIFEARRNLSNANNALFFMGDIKNLPFKEKFANFIYCLGVLHHLPANALDEVRNLKRYSSDILVYLYYALDNRPIYFHIILKIVTSIRYLLAKIRNKKIRKFLTEIITWFIYVPLINIGSVFEQFDLGKKIPLYEGYSGKSIERIRQDVYDRFFTRIEQRYSRAEIYTLKDEFSSILISDGQPYWHFLCRS